MAPSAREPTHRPLHRSSRPSTSPRHPHHAYNYLRNPASHGRSRLACRPVLPTPRDSITGVEFWSSGGCVGRPIVSASLPSTLSPALRLRVLDFERLRTDILVSYIIGVMKRESPRAIPKHLALEQRRPGRRDSISELGPRIGARPCQLKGELKDDLACAGGWEQKFT